jgi:hypothetical protein
MRFAFCVNVNGTPFRRVVQLDAAAASNVAVAAVAVASCSLSAVRTGCQKAAVDFSRLCDDYTLTSKKMCE